MSGTQSIEARQPRRIVILEDDQDLTHAISAVLEADGFEVVHFDNGEAGISYLNASSTPPLLILLDLSMPVVNGWEFRRRQVQDPRIAGVPVIVMSAHQTGVLADASGISFHLKKPFSLDTLLGYIRRLSNRSDS